MGERYLKTEDEDIRKYYPAATREEMLELIPTRTWAQIGVHARKMGVHRTTQSWGNSIREGRKVLKGSWSDKDNERLSHFYPHATRARLLDAFPSRTWFSIQSHAHKRHLHRTRVATGLQICIGRENARKEN